MGASVRAQLLNLCWLMRCTLAHRCWTCNFQLSIKFQVCTPGMSWRSIVKKLLWVFWMHGNVQGTKNNERILHWLWGHSRQNLWLQVIWVLLWCALMMPCLKKNKLWLWLSRQQTAHTGKSTALVETQGLVREIKTLFCVNLQQHGSNKHHKHNQRVL